ncbi:hypothetical protein CY0110_19977 [Crocosphaera chwakensis CCY0110]|uniref:Uncharacterized protein n=1 Tax=Crocosphaera chwakensis CCY0110 TaxID=391612 RepID=A3IJX7_9CHRO|nr:hypothetical protein CY0110_19977 [Crocosphaera chwakensis CCY0110]
MSTGCGYYWPINYYRVLIIGIWDISG